MDAHGGGGAGLRFGQGTTLKFGGHNSSSSGMQHRRKNERKPTAAVVASARVDGAMWPQGVALSGARTLVLMVGGVTFGESKAVHTLMKETGRELVMLTTGFLTPLAFCDQIRKMGKDDDEDDGENSASSSSESDDADE